MAAAMEFCLLGPLRVGVDGLAVPVPRGKQRVVLAALLLHAGRTVTADQLTELLWGPVPPPSAPVTLQNYVKRLRGALGAGRDRVVTQPGGYLIRVAPGELDITAMEEALARAHHAARAGAWREAATQSAIAVALWRGEPLCDVDLGASGAPEAARLTELRFQARVLRLEAGLELGRHAELVSEARQLADEAHLREHAHALLMRALHQCGRRAEALEAYRHARSLLVEELGCEPGPELQALHREILDDSHAPPSREPRAALPPVPVPRELPAAVAGFTGRETELAALDDLLGAPRAGSPLTMLISAIAGTAGVGKTALAVHWAHRTAAGGFPDGQLYVNLRGYDPGPPVPAADALAGFLRALGVRAQDVPAEEGERAARYRSLLAGRRLLVVLDNARDADQVRPLLPGTPGCVVLVTSRDALAGLVARDGVRRLDLDLLVLSDALRLLRALIGSRVQTEPEATAALATLCCRLPLALRVAAELAAARPAARLADLVAELADQQHRLDLLDAGGDVRTAVRAVFSWSYRHLDGATAGVFRLLGAHPGTSYDAHAMAALAGVTAAEAAQALDLLHRAYLVQPAGPGRYSQHDLLRAYARELGETGFSPAEREAAQTRLMDYYLHAAGTAVDALFPADGDIRSRPGPPTPVSPDDPAAALAWLDGERANLVAIAGLAAGQLRLEQVTELTRMLFRYLDSGGHYAEASAIHAHARHAASQLGDIAAEANALIDIGIAEARQCSHREAVGHLRQALALFREAGDRVGEARSLVNLGATLLRQGSYQDAAAHLQGALPLLRDLGHRGEASALNNLGLTCIRLGQYRQAAEYLDRSLVISREHGSLPSEGRALTNLGIVETRQGRHKPADAHLSQALALFRQAGDRVGEAYALSSLGELQVCTGDHDQAASCYRQALSLFREMDDRFGEAVVLNDFGGVLLATGDVTSARDWYGAALELTDQIGDRYRRAWAHDGLAQTYQADGEEDKARDHWQRALVLFEELGVPQADHVRGQLAAVRGESVAPGRPA
jgi:DNA-binding SARP family transcriptional activator/Tfp pilus assembly protein PilF